MKRSLIVFALLVLFAASPAGAQWGAQSAGWQSIAAPAGGGIGSITITTSSPLTGGAAACTTSPCSWTLGLGVVPATLGGMATDVSGQTGIALNTAGVFSFLGSSGTGNVARVTSPAFTTPSLGVATGTSFNGLIVTTTTGTFTLTGGKTFSVSNTLTLTGTDGSSVAFGAGGTVAYTANKLNAFASTSSSELAGTISDETGSGLLMFATSPNITTGWTVGSDITFARLAAASIRMGAAASATPVAQTITCGEDSRGGTDSNVAGSNCTFRTGNGTGNAASSSFIVQTPTAGSSGTSQESYATRMTVTEGGTTFVGNVTSTGALTTDWNAGWRFSAGARIWSTAADIMNFGASGATTNTALLGSGGLTGGRTKTLTESSATGFVTITSTSGEACAARVPYTVFAKDATNTQSVTGEVFVSFVSNSSGTVTKATLSDQHVLNPVSSGTLTNTFTDTTGTNTYTLNSNAASSLTQTTLEIRYRVEFLAGAASCTVTGL